MLPPLPPDFLPRLVSPDLVASPIFSSHILFTPHSTSLLFLLLSFSSTFFRILPANIIYLKDQRGSAPILRLTDAEGAVEVLKYVHHTLSYSLLYHEISPISACTRTHFDLPHRLTVISCSSRTFVMRACDASINKFIVLKDGKLSI